MDGCEVGGEGCDEDGDKADNQTVVILRLKNSLYTKIFNWATAKNSVFYNFQMCASKSI